MLRLPGSSCFAPALLMVVCLIAPAQQPTDATISTQIEGDVLNAVTSESVPRASLILRRSDDGPYAKQSPSAYSGSADQNGHFEMKGIAPGKYRLFASRTGFVSSEFAAPRVSTTGKSLLLETGHPVDGLVFRLMPHSVITGRLTDEHGDPVPFAQVQAVGYRYSRGRRQMASFGTASTNDLGEYRIFGLPPGRYYLRAMYQQGTVSAQSADQMGEQDYVTTYYPHGTDPTLASLVEAKPGMQLSGFDFALSRVHSLHIRGRVNRALPGGLTTLRLAPADSPELSEMNHTYVTDSRGYFDIGGVLSGNYTLMASEFINGVLMTAKAAVEASANSEDLELTLSLPLRVSGSIHVGGGHTVNISSVCISLQARDRTGPLGPDPFTCPNEDGTFSLFPVSADSYFVNFRGLPDGYYVKSAMLGNEDIMEAGLDLHPGANGTITVALSLGAGRLDGLVVDEKGNPAPGATVVLIPQEDSRREQDRFYRTTTTDDNGSFALTNVDIGKFKLFAWEDIEFDAWMDAAVVKPVEGRGEPLTVKENTRSTLRLTLIPTGAH